MQSIPSKVESGWDAAIKEFNKIHNVVYQGDLYNYYVEDDAVYQRPHLQFDLADGSTVLDYFDTSEEAEEELKKILESNPSIKVHR